MRRTAETCAEAVSSVMMTAAVTIWFSAIFLAAIPSAALVLALWPIEAAARRRRAP